MIGLAHCTPITNHPTSLAKLSMQPFLQLLVDLPSLGMKANFLGIAVLAVAILNTDSFGEKNAITELPGDFTGSFGKRQWPEKVKKPADGLPIVASHAGHTTHDLRQPNQGWPNTVSKSILEGFPQLAGLRK
jgi:hypothetical protein